MNYLLSIDQGTTSSRALLYDLKGRRTAVAQEEFTQFFPRSGWVEHDAMEIWESVLSVVKAVLQEQQIGAGDLRAIGITNQRETVVLWDRKTGQPLHNAIVWQDRRTSDRMGKLQEEGRTDWIAEKTGLLPDPYFSASKIAWLLDQVEGARERAEAGELAAGTIDSWLTWQLTGGKHHLTDVTNASRTMLMNLRTCQWDKELLDLFSIPASLLPSIVPTSGTLGETAAEIFGEPVVIAALVGDQQSALFGQLCTEPGGAKCTYGTGCFLLRHTGTAPVTSRNRLLGTVAWQLQGKPVEYALEGSVFVGGAAIQWLRDGLGLIASAPEVNDLAAMVPDTGGVVIVPAFTGLGAPHWDPSARGAVFGIDRATTAAHLARATLEGIAFQVADLLDAMEADSGSPLESLRVDGGASASDLLMQMQSDFLGLEVERPADLETTALGAALLAGLGAGVWTDLGELTELRQTEKTFTPQLEGAGRKSRREQWSKAVQRAGHWEENE